ncbi:Alpha-pyrone synthesis polyketide synthase-like Pks11 [bacterium HR36]|nr:Alpha-pyrone synthesis polyketide synthase-like Pks11 [bacterium HR36]
MAWQHPSCTHKATDGSQPGESVTPQATAHPTAPINGALGPSTAQRLALYIPAAAQLAVQAAQQALGEACCSPAEVTHLITASCTGFYSPGVDIQLLRQLGLRTQVQRLHVGYMGCHAAVNALRAAQGFLACAPEGCVLLCCVELCSVHWQLTSQPEKWLGNVLFADGAAALVLRRAAGEFWKLADSASYLLPETEHLMAWMIGDHGFEMYLAPQLPGLLRRTVGSWVADWLQRHRLTLEDIASWAVHPGGPKILQAVAASLGLAAEQLQASWQVLANYGNMSSPTILFVLNELRRAQAPRPCVALAFGPGLSLEAALFV